MKKGGNWSQAEDLTLRDELKKGTPLRTIAIKMGKTQKAVYLYCYRHYIPMRTQVKNPLMQKLLEIKFGDIELFHPNQSFFDKTGINQKRWGELAFGYCQPSQEEMLRVARALNFDVDESLKLFEAKQLGLFDSDK